MSSIIGALNMTLDGYCDHNAVDASEALHQYWASIIDNAGVLMYGRVTYQLMEYWKTLLDTPSGNAFMDAFAVSIDRVPKIVFSRTLQALDWKSARLADEDLKMATLKLKEMAGKDIYACSRSLIVQLLDLSLLDQLQIVIHPVVAGKGLPLFQNLQAGKKLHLLRTEKVGTGALALYYQPLHSS
ncbi:dihydrofolate reductase family protein [Niabella terrae]